VDPFSAGTMELEYDVFLSHCGQDTKRGFANWLRLSLERVGVSCFFDEKSLEGGDEAPKSMLAAMETAKIGVIVLSPGFFKQEWCMKELQAFARRGRVFPIFYPSFEAVAKAKDEAVAEKVWEQFKQCLTEEQEYRETLKALNVTGVRLDSFDGFEASCIYDATRQLVKLLDRSEAGVQLSSEGLLVGQVEHLRTLKELLGVSLEGSAASSASTQEEVGIVGVKGMGGIGKSTLARKLSDDRDVRNHFNGNVCWLKVGPDPSDKEICELQRQVILQLCDLDEKPQSSDLGKSLIKARLKGKRVLICLDDVWEKVEVVEVGDLGPGSRILKTSRNKQAIDGQVYNLEILDPHSAWELFCWHAFGGKEPQEELAEEVTEAVNRCAGLPLAIKLLGAQLAGAESKANCLKSFLSLPEYDDAMFACQSIIKSSFVNLPPNPPGLRDAILLVAGLWPATDQFRKEGNALQNLGAAVYGAERAEHRELLAEKALEKLKNCSMIRVEAGEDGARIEIHDLLVDVAKSLVKEGEWADKRRFFTWEEASDPESFEHPDWKHVVVLSGELPITKFLFSPKSSILSLIVARPARISDWSTINQKASQCRLFDVDGALCSSLRRSLRLQEFKDLQCLRLQYCNIQELPEGIEGLKHLRVLVILRSNVSRDNGECYFVP
jgi:hypothetical protein